MEERETELAELAGSFIHEIKNHLGTLGLNLQLLAEEFDSPQSQRERRAAERIVKLQQQCQHVVDVSHDFLRFARIQNLDLIPSDLGHIVDELIDFVAPTAVASNIEIKAFLPADLPPVALDRDLFKQALLNLFLNAEQALDDGGKITLQAVIERDADSLSSAVALRIIDTGKGISQQVMDRIFEPFFSTREGGSGLGLPTTRRIIEAHGGVISVESEEGHGTQFTIRLPV